MTKEEKLEFIYSVPSKLAMTDHRGCEPDWFIETHREDNDYKSEYGNPKYIKIKFNDTIQDGVLVLYYEDEYICKYWLYGRSNVICDSNKIKNELLWFNGRKSESLGNISYEESSEDDLIDWMYSIAFMYYDRDIKPMLEKKQIQIDKEYFKNSFAKNYFKL